MADQNERRLEPVCRNYRVSFTPVRGRSGPSGDGYGSSTAQGALSAKVTIGSGAGRGPLQIRFSRYPLKLLVRPAFPLAFQADPPPSPPKSREYCSLALAEW